MSGHIKWTFWAQKLHRYKSFIDNEFWRVVEKVEFFIYNSCCEKKFVFYIYVQEKCKISPLSPPSFRKWLIYKGKTPVEFFRGLALWRRNG